MIAWGRVQIVGGVGHLRADTGRAVDQAVDEWRGDVLEDLLGRGQRRWLRPVVVLHRDHEYLSDAWVVVAIVMSLGVGREAARRQPSPQCQDTHRQSTLHVRHAFLQCRDRLGLVTPRWRVSLTVRRPGRKDGAKSAATAD